MGGITYWVCIISNNIMKSIVLICKPIQLYIKKYDVN